MAKELDLGMREERIIQEIGGITLSISIPLSYAQFLGIEKGSVCIIAPFEGENGRYIAFWKKEVGK